MPETPLIVDERDFDALSESSYDFGHFQELDSDADDAGVVDDSLDPYTAALREDAALKTADESAALVEQEDAVAFTQKLLTNVQTLKQLRESGAPEIEIEYEAGHDLDDVRSPLKIGAGVADSGFYPPSSPDILTQGVPKQRTSQNERQSQSSQHQRPGATTSNLFTAEAFRLLQSASDDELVAGRYERLPAELLRAYSYDQCRLILDQTRLYHGLGTGDHFPEICLKNLWKGQDVLHAPILRIVGVNGNNVLLADHHDSVDSCQTLACVESITESITNDSFMQLLEFHFDHTAVMKSSNNPKKVTVTEQLDESFHDSYFSSQNTISEPLIQSAEGLPFPAAQASKPQYSPMNFNKHHQADIGPPPNQVPAMTQLVSSPPDQEVTSTSILVVAQYKIIDSQTFQALRNESLRKHEEIRNLYDRDVKDVNEPTTQNTVETNYSDKFENQLDPDDFPIEDVS